MKALYNCANNIIALCSPEDDEGDWIYDQLIFFTLIDEKKVEVKIFNKDGSLAGNCLNGLRALVHYLDSELKINHPLDFFQNNKKLGFSTFKNHKFYIGVEIPEVVETKNPMRIKLGNEHLVFWHLGLNFNKPQNYIPQTNEEYILNYNGNIATTRVYESGVGETGSCGSGAVAVGYYLFLKYGNKEFVIRYPGGDLETIIENNQILLSGPILRTE